jgi:dephospho-CoA kinase
MLIVALTGGIGSGKSTAGQIFSNLGAIVIDSDQLAREVIKPGSEGFDLLIKEFGTEILENNEINRAALGAIIFADPTLRAKLEAITHPLIRQSFEKLVQAAPSDAIVINQIPLLVESNHDYKFDKVIAISVSDQIRKQRLLERGLSQSDADKRMSAQASDAQREAIADFIIENSGDLAELTHSVTEIWQKLMAANLEK